MVFMAEPRFRKLFRSAKSGPRQAHVESTAHSSQVEAEQQQLFTGDSIPVGELASRVVAAEASPTVAPAAQPLAGAARLSSAERESTPQQTVAAYLGAAVQLRDSGRFEEAETLLN